MGAHSGIFGLIERFESSIMVLSITITHRVLRALGRWSESFVVSSCVDGYGRLFM